MTGNVLITGGTGSLGKALVQELMTFSKYEGNVFVFSRDEYKQYNMTLEYPKELYPNLHFILGDIRDKDRILEATIGIDYIIHAAALKHVSVAEENVMEFVKTNIIGSDNVLDSAKTNNVKKVILISTDKAVYPQNIYGTTKLCAEKLFLTSCNKLTSCKTSQILLRFGNIIGSRGSVFPYLLKHRSRSSICLTNPEMTRFYSDINQVVYSILYALKNGVGGEVFIPKSRSIKLDDLARAILPNVDIQYDKPKSGEKFHEALIAANEVNFTYEMEDFYIITPGESYVFPEEILEKYPTKVTNSFSLSSNNKNLLLRGKELEDFIQFQINNFKL